MITKRLKANINANAIIDIDSSLKEQIDKNSQDIIANATNINTNTTNIQVNTTDIGNLRVEVNDAVAKVDGFENRIAANEANIATNTQGIIDVNERIDNLPSPDLSNYYTKAEVDASQEAQNTKIDNNTDLINQNIQDIGEKANQTDLTALTTRVQTNETNIGAKANTADVVLKRMTASTTISNTQNTIISARILNLTTTTGDMEIRVPTGKGIDVGNKPIFNIPEPRNGNEAATKTYVDTSIANIPAVDLSNYYTKAEVDASQQTQDATIQQNTTDIASKADETEVAALELRVSAAETTANTNTTKIADNLRQINELIEENKKQVNIVFEIEAATTYKKGDQGYKGTQWYLCIAETALGSETANPAKWKQINYQTEVDLSNYYTKPETNNLLSPLDTELTALKTKDTQQDAEISLKANQTDLQALAGQIATKAEQSDLQALQVSVGTNTTNIATNTAAIATKANDNQVVKLAEEQTITGTKTLGTELKAGYGGGAFLLTPEDNSTKVIKFGDAVIGDRNRFNLDLEGKSYIKNVPAPVEGSDAASKWYVDTQVATANSLQTENIPKAEVNLIRCDRLGQRDANGDFVWWNSNNQIAKDFIWNQGTKGQKNMYIYIKCERDKYIINNITIVDDSSTRLMFPLPAFNGQIYMDRFLDKSAIREIKLGVKG